MILPFNTEFPFILHSN